MWVHLRKARTFVECTIYAPDYQVMTNVLHILHSQSPREIEFIPYHSNFFFQLIKAALNQLENELSSFINWIGSRIEGHSKLASELHQFLEFRKQLIKLQLQTDESFAILQQSIPPIPSVINQIKN